MTYKEIPGWYTKTMEIIIRQHRPLKGEPTLAEVYEYAWEWLTKPENLTKIPEIRALIESLKMYQDTLSEEEDVIAFNKAYEALKPFNERKEGET